VNRRGAVCPSAREFGVFQDKAAAERRVDFCLDSRKDCYCSRDSLSYGE
jgi:hypothetical protein